MAVWRVRSNRILTLKAMLMLSVFLVILPSLQCQSSKPEQQNVIFITIDTLRADHLGCYGYPRQTSPAIDKFAEKAVLFEDCIAQATSTLPSHASIFTSLYPPAHGVIHNIAGLSKDIPSLVNVFRANGYFTGAIISNLVLESRFGLAQGFETYDEELESHELNREKFRERRADAATDCAIDWLNRHSRRKFFLWLHYIDPHGAYYPPAEYREMFTNDEWYSEAEQLPIGNGNIAARTIPEYQALFGIRNTSYYVAQYDGEIRFTDDQLGRFLRHVDDLGLMSNSIVVITADHGETLTERDICFSHTFRTYDEQARIPLIIRFPDTTPPGRISDQVRAIDIMPTLLDKLHIKNPYPVHGQSLMALITQGKKPDTEFTVISSDHGLQVLDSVIGSQKSLRTSHWKFTRNSWDGSSELYNLHDDPMEKNNLVSEEPAVRREMEELLEEWGKSINSAPLVTPHISEEKIKQLESLGYMTK